METGHYKLYINYITKNYIDYKGECYYMKKIIRFCQL